MVRFIEELSTIAIRGIWTREFGGTHYADSYRGTPGPSRKDMIADLLWLGIYSY